MLRLLEEGRPVDVILFSDTGLEFPQMYEHLNKLEQYTDRTITRLKPPHSFETFFYEYSPKRKNPALDGLRGLSWPGPKQRWFIMSASPPMNPIASGNFSTLLWNGV